VSSDLNPPDPFQDRAIGDLQNRVAYLEAALVQVNDALRDVLEDNGELLRRVKILERATPLKRPPRAGKPSGRVVRG